MTNATEFQQWIGHNAVDSDDNKIGKIGQIYLDDRSGAPTWVTVSTGMFGSKESFAPLYGCSASGDDLKLTVSKQMVKDAPSVDADGRIDDDEANRLYTHYQGLLGPSRDGGDAGREGGRDAGDTREDLAGKSGVQGRDTSGPTTDEAMTRSEERLHVGTESVQTGRARLRKYIVEEQVTQTVPVRHEEVRIEREPITDANRGDAVAGAELSEEEHEVTLHAERPVVSKETTPVERVKIATDSVSGEQRVEETVRKEQIDQPDVQDDRSKR